MAEKPELTYVVERAQNACEKCGQGEQWEVVGPDGGVGGVFYGDEDEADRIAEDLNEALLAGIASGEKRIAELKSQLAAQEMAYDNELRINAKMEAQCAEMRAALEKFRHERDCSCTDCIAVDALLSSTDAGKGWVSPEEAKALRDSVTLRQKHHGDDVVLDELEKLRAVAKIAEPIREWMDELHQATQAGGFYSPDEHYSDFLADLEAFHNALDALEEKA